MIEKVLNRVVKAVKYSNESAAEKLAGKVKSDFARSPKADIFAGDSLKLTNPIKAPKALISHEQAVRNDDMAVVWDLLKENKYPKQAIDSLKKAAAHTNPDGSYRFKLEEILNITGCVKPDKYKNFAKLVDCKKPDGAFRFDANELLVFSSMGDKRFSRVEKMLSVNTMSSEWLFKLSFKNIDPKRVDTLVSAKAATNDKLKLDYDGIESALTPGGVDLEKLLPRLKDKLARDNGNLNMMIVSKPHPTPGEFQLTYAYKNRQAEEILFDGNGKRINFIKSDVKYNEKGQPLRTQKVYDARNRTYSVIRSVKKDSRFVVKSETKLIKDKAGNVVRTEVLSPSDIDGIYNVKSIDAKGNVTILSSGVKDKNGCVTVKKNFESLDGTKTHYEYYDDPQGNRITYYKIIDKKGKVLLDDTKSFEVVDKNTAISTHGNKSYEIKNDATGLKIRNLQTDELTQIDFGKFLLKDNAEIKQFLSKVNAEELIVLNKKGIKLNYVEELLKSALKHTRQLNTVPNMFVFEHEIGHAKDMNNYNPQAFFKNLTASDRPQLVKIHNQERKAFYDAFPLVHEKHIDYFINKVNHGEGKKGAILETVAETNGMLNSYQSTEMFGIRTNFLQQYFPRTIAKAAKLLDTQV